MPRRSSSFRPMSSNEATGLTLALVSKTSCLSSSKLTRPPLRPPALPAMASALAATHAPSSACNERPACPIARLLLSASRQRSWPGACSRQSTRCGRAAFRSRRTLKARATETPCASRAVNAGRGSDGSRRAKRRGGGAGRRVGGKGPAKPFKDGVQRTQPAKRRKEKVARTSLAGHLLAGHYLWGITRGASLVGHYSWGTTLFWCWRGASGRAQRTARCLRVGSTRAELARCLARDLRDRSLRRAWPPCQQV